MSDNFKDDRFNQLISGLQLFEKCRLNLRSIYQSLLLGNSKHAIEKLLGIAGRLIQYADTAPDSSLFVCNTSPGRMSDDGKAVRAAILAALLGSRASLKRTKLVSTVCAALSADVAQSHQLSTPMQKQDHDLAHPRRSADLLIENGLKDELWIETVCYHHELLDGSGYPLHLTDMALKVSVRTLAIVTAYIDYRGTSAEALKALYMDRGKKYDALLVQQFVKELGVYPPGSVVALDDDSCAIVWQSENRAGEIRLLNISPQASAAPFFSMVANLPGNKIARTASPEDCCELFQWIANLADCDLSC